MLLATISGIKINLINLIVSSHKPTQIHQNFVKALVSKTVLKY